MVQNPLTNQIAALSVGIVDGDFISDLDYEKDSSAEVDLNLVLNDKFEILEIQGTAEQKPFSKEEFNTLINLAENGIKDLIFLQREIIEDK